MTNWRLGKLTNFSFGFLSLVICAASIFLPLHSATLADEGSASDLPALNDFIRSQGFEPQVPLQDTGVGPSVAETKRNLDEALREGVDRLYVSTADFESLPSAIESIEGLSPADAQTMAQEIQILFNKLVAHGRAEEARLGKEGFKKALLLNEIVYSDNVDEYDRRGRTGRAELNLVDGVKFQRVIHADSEISFAFIPVDKVSENSKHEARIIASQHLTAGKSRTDGQLGRDTVNIYYRWNQSGELEIDSVRYFQRHATWSKAWWRDQMLISLYAPTLPDIFVSGLFWGGIQLAQSWLIHPEDHTQMIFTGCFGAACGVFATSLRKFNQIGGKIENLVRNSFTTTIPFIVPYAFMDQNRSFDSTTKIALFVLVEIPLFCILSNFSKIPLQRIVKEISDKGLIRESTFAGVKMGNWLYQGLYNFLVFPIRIIFLKSHGGLKLKDSLGFDLGWGRLTLPLLYPVLWQAQVAFAEKIGVEDARKQRIEFEKSTVGATTGLWLGSIHDIAEMPFWLVDRWLWGEISSRPKEFVAWQRLRSRWSLQIHGPAYHTGRIIEAFGRFLRIQPDEMNWPAAHRFQRIKETDFPPEPASLITQTSRKLKNFIAATMNFSKISIDRLTQGGVDRCHQSLERLGANLKKPFLDRLEKFQFPSASNLTR